MINSISTGLKHRIKQTALGPFLLEVHGLVKRRDQYQLLRRDLKETSCECAFFRELTETKASGKRALIVTAGSGILNGIKLEAWLGLGLRMRGWQIEVLLPGSSNYWSRRYFQALGFQNFVYPRKYPLSDELKRQCQADSETFLATNLIFQTVKNWHYEGVWIGPYLLSILQRSQKLGSPDLNDPELVRQLYTALPNWLTSVKQSRFLLQDVQPDVLYLIDPNGVNRPLVDNAIHMGIDVIVVSQPYRDDALVLKRFNRKTSRTQPNSVTRATLERLVMGNWTARHEEALGEVFRNRYDGTWFLQSRNQPGTVLKSKDNIVKQLGLNPEKKIAVIFAHILWDANLFYGEDLFEDYSDWFRQTVRAACRNEKLNWLVKLHPANLWKRSFENDAGELAELTVLKQNGLWPLPDHVQLLYPDTDISTLSLYENIDYGITVRGSLGIELPCFGASTLTAGTGRYSGFGFTLDFSSTEAYLNKLACLQEQPPISVDQRQLAKWHAYTVFRLRPWEFSSFRSTFGDLKQKRHPLAYNVQPAVRSLDEITKNGDLDRWVDWVEDADRPADYLNDPGEGL